jgi:hypothetical protein
MTSEAEFLGQANAQAQDQTDDNQTEENQVDDNQTDDNQEQGEELQLTKIEQKAYDQGWRPQDDFTGDEDSWKTAREYVQYGEIITLVKQNKKDNEDLKRDFDERLENTNKLNEARRKSEISDLKTKQREAVDLADTDAYDVTQKKIDELESQAVTTQPAQQGKDPDITEWETKNPWINDPNDERTAVAQSIFNNYTAQNKGATNAQALAHVDGKISKLYPTENTNARRDQPNTTESVARKPQRRNKDLSMADLTGDEKEEWNMFGRTMFKSEKAFLKAVKDARVK